LVNDKVEVNIFPNPTSKAITIQTNTKGPFRVTIKDLLGRIIKVEHINNHGDINLEPGSYLIIVQNQTIKTVERVFVY
jgi:hypothetical protein